MGLEWQYPIFFLLIVFVALVLIFPRRSRWFLRTATIASLSQAVKKFQGRTKFKNRLPYLLFGCGLLFLIIAAADPTSGKKQLQHRYLIHTYLVINDGSGSMIDHIHPRGVGERINALLAGNKTFLDATEAMSRPSNEKDAVGVILFSSDAFILSYPDTNYDNLWLKLNKINWRNRPLGLGTEINKALWVAIQATIQRNQQVGGESFTSEELADLQHRVSDGGRRLNLSPALQQKIELVAEEVVGTSFIVFTDGEFNLDPYSHYYSSQLSAAKNLLLCQRLGIRVYLIAAEIKNQDVIPLIKKTGGSFYYLKKAKDADLLQKAYLDILQQQANELIVEDEEIKISYYLWPAIIGFSLICLGILARYTISRSLTVSC